MMNNDMKPTTKYTWNQFSPLFGFVLIISGLLFLLDQKINTNWLSLSLPIIISLVFLIAGFISKRRILLIPGFICFGLSSAFFILFQNIYKPQNIFHLIAMAIGVFAVSWLLLFLSLTLIRNSMEWWTLFVALIAGAVSFNFTLKELTFLRFMFSISLAIGFVFLFWSMKKKQLGLLIPRLLTSTIGAGIFFAWNHEIDSTGLQQTGTMLVWFALGWILITVISKIFSRKFVWWPLIPGGVLAMVGSGLYIGGNPSNALGFFQNTGSIGLIMFGIYLILLKYGMNK
jgi:hypothetical protein